MWTNPVMWLPIFLIAIERARTRRLIPCLLLATAAYTMSVLTGIGQPFVYTGVLALAYATFVSLFPKKFNENPEDKPEERDYWQRWKPLAVAIGAIALASGVAAFQIMETWRAAKMSVRGVLSYELFSEGSLPLSLAFKGWLQQLFPVGDATPFVLPLTTGLAIISIAFSIRQSHRDPLVFFWLIVAIAAFILILGKYTPIYYAIYKLPFINLFRVPARHSFEWTFALSILGAYGWDAITALSDKRQQMPSAWRERFGIFLGTLSLAASLFVGVMWWKLSGNPLDDNNLSPEIFHYPYLILKAAFTFLIFTSLWWFWRMKIGRWRMGLLASVLILACFVEPFINNSRSHSYFVVPTNRFSTFAPITKFLRQYPPEQNRVYSDISPFGYSQSEKPPMDSVNLTALAGIHHISGYEPLIQERYSRALNNLPWEQVNRGPWLGPNPALFESNSHVLDLLNTTFAIAPSVSNDTLEARIEKDGIKFSTSYLEVDLKPDKPVRLTCEGAEGDTVAFVTSLSNAANIADKSPVARLSIYTSDGRVIERQLLAGIDTSEWAYERADVKPVIQHALAPVFDSYYPGDSDNSWSAHRFLSRINLGERVQIEHVEITKTQTQASLELWKASLYDSTSSRSTLFSIVPSEKWQMVYLKDGVKILRNLHPLPRAWLVSEAIAVDKAEAWAAIRGQGSLTFDPRKTALLELEPHKMPPLSGRPLTNDSYARIVSYEPNRLVIETKSDQTAVLVVSEMHYPGWVAMLDGLKTPIHNTNFLLRGVVVPAGTHRIEMSYRAPGARNGAIVSLFTLILIGGMAVYAKQTSAR